MRRKCCPQQINTRTILAYLEEIQEYAIWFGMDKKEGQRSILYFEGQVCCFAEAGFHVFFLRVFRRDFPGGFSRLFSTWGPNFFTARDSEFAAFCVEDCVERSLISVFYRRHCEEICRTCRKI